MNGTLAQREREESRGRGCRAASMTPSGRRTATAQAWGPRIMTPSRTAWPPTVRAALAFCWVLSLAVWSLIGSVSIYLMEVVTSVSRRGCLNCGSFNRPPVTWRSLIWASLSWSFFGAGLLLLAAVVG